MAHDYKNRSAPARKTRAKLEPAPSRSRSIPGFVWGLLLGLLLAAGWWQWQKQVEETPPVAPKPPDRKVPPTQPTATPQPTAEEAAAATNENQTLPPPRESEFSFYRLLHEYELLIPEEDEVVADSRPRQANEAVAAAPRLAPDKRYIVQVGSFGKAKDAGNRRAELALLGLEAYVQPVTLKPGETWHRVRIGPLDGEPADQTVALLRAEGFEYFVAKAK